jgi:hypothetical protein
MNYRKPINLLDGRSYRTERLAVLDAIADIFIAAQLERALPVLDHGCWRHPQYMDAQGYMAPYLSVTWYIEQAREPSRRRVNAQRLLAAFRSEPWRRAEALGDHYDVLLLDDVLFDPAEEEHFGLATTPGYAAQGVAAILSMHGLNGHDRVGYSLLKTLAMRELAHAFGVPGLRRQGLQMTPRLACTNACLLGPCLRVPEDLERLTDLRLAGPPFCDECLAEVRDHLRPSKAES